MSNHAEGGHGPEQSMNLENKLTKHPEAAILLARLDEVLGKGNYTVTEKGAVLPKVAVEANSNEDREMEDVQSELTALANRIESKVA